MPSAVTFAPHEIERGLPELLRHREDPIAFIREVLGVEYVWELMETMSFSVRDNRRTAVAGCHDSSKTFTAACLAWWWIQCFQPAKVVAISTKEDQLKETFWADLRTLHEQSRVPIGGDMQALKWRSPHADTLIVGMTARKDTGGSGATGMQGYKSPRLLLVMDEAVGIERPFFESARGILGSEGSRWLAMANPTNPNCGFHDCWRPNSGWNTINISAFDTPNIRAGKMVNPYTPNPTWIEENRKEWGEGSPSWESRVLGQFPSEAMDTLIGIADLQRAFDRKPTPRGPGDPTETFVGVDFARQGDDRSSIVVIRNDELVHLEAFQIPDLMKVSDKAIKIAQDWGIPQVDAHRISIDSGGLGLGCLDYMRRQGWFVNPEDFGTKAHSPEKFYLRRTELWVGVRDWLRSSASLAACEPRERQMLESDLCGCTVETRPYAGHTVFKLEPKDHMKSRLGHSPDVGDAVALALAWRSRRRSLFEGLTAGKVAKPVDDPRRAAGPTPEDRDHPHHERWKAAQDFYGRGGEGAGFYDD